MNRDVAKLLLAAAAHAAIGVVIYLVHPLAKVYGYGIIAWGILFILKNKNAHHEALLVGGYMVGSEAFLRMTNGNPVYEFSKYGIISVLLLGMYFRGFSRNAIPYWIFALLLVPGVIIGTYDLNYKTDLAKIISFNISGPLCLTVVALYSYRRRYTIDQLHDLMLYIGLPIITMTVYLILYTPDLRDVITGTGSNFETSGGFGPNQVATILGLGMFIFTTRAFLNSSTMLMTIVNLLLAIFISYRGLITFSRGGMLTGAAMLLIMLVMIFLRVNIRGRGKLTLIIAGMLIVSASIWSYSSLQTGGLINKRYANEDAAGRVKESRFSGREKISESEIKFFLSAPVFGIGIGKGAEKRLKETGQTILSHSEVTRLMAEHGAFGIMALFILILTPLILYLDNKDHIFMASFVCFWLFTINHAAMRLAAPAFIYGLSVLQIIWTHAPKPALHRE